MQIDLLSNQVTNTTKQIYLHPNIYIYIYIPGDSSVCPLFITFILSQIEKLFKYNFYDILLSIYVPYAFVYRVLLLSATICNFIFLNGTP